jgi:hypothetical protein
MKISRIYGAAIALVFLTLSAKAGSVPLDTLTYNFQLANGGGGATATLNGVPVEIFCDDFANDIGLNTDYTANVTTLSTTPNLGLTRFGNVKSTSWVAINLPSGYSTDQTFLNGASASERYDMAAYLVSLYNVSQGSSTSNNQIQEAIWTLMDPTAAGAAPSGYGPNGYLEQAANWYINGGATNTFLSQFQIVSDVNMHINPSARGTGGFQEQIVYTDPPSAVPEPRGSALILIGVFGISGLLLQRRARARNAATVLCSESAAPQA